MTKDNLLWGYSDSLMCSFKVLTPVNAGGVLKKEPWHYAIRNVLPHVT